MLNDRDFRIELENYKIILNGTFLIVAAIIGTMLFTDRINTFKGIGFSMGLFILSFALSISIRARLKED